MTLFDRMQACGLRRFAALYALAFLASVAIAPHRHLNSFEDLISDGPSDSGFFEEPGRPMDPAAGLQWSSNRLTDDDPCLACFHHDFRSAAEAIALFTLAPRLSSLFLTPRHPAPAAPAPPIRRSRSRSPPALA